MYYLKPVVVELARVHMTVHIISVLDFKTSQLTSKGELPSCCTCTCMIDSVIYYNSEIKSIHNKLSFVFFSNQ